MRTFSYSIAVLATLAAGAIGADRGYTITTIAGTDSVADGGPAAAAPLGSVEGIARDVSGNLYLADAADHRIRKISPAGTITTVAGNGHAGSEGDDAPAAAAFLSSPYGIVFLDGNLYIADYGNGCVRRIGADGIISTIARANARFAGPRNVAADEAGNIYVSDFLAHRVYRIAGDGTLSVFAGTGIVGYSGDAGAAAAAMLNHPAGLAVDAWGGVYIADSGNNRIRRVFQGFITTVFGGPSLLSGPTGLALDSTGALYIADGGNNRVWRWTPAAGGMIIAKDLPSARDVAADAGGAVYVAAGSRVLRVWPGGYIDTVAGDGTYRFRGDGGPAAAARLDSPFGLAIDVAGRLYVSDQGNRRVRAIARSGIIQTAAGPNDLGAPAGLAPGPAGDILIADYETNRIRRLSTNGMLGAAAIAGLNHPLALAADQAGGVYIADSGNHSVRKLARDGTVSTLATDFDTPKGVALDHAGNIYVADAGLHVVRRLTPLGAISTIAGTGAPGSAGIDGRASAAQLNAPSGLAFDKDGDLLIADTMNHRVVMVDHDGVLRLVAGSGARGFGGDSGPALAALLDSPVGLAVDEEGGIYIADHGNRRVRKLTPRAALVEPAPVHIPPLVIVNAASMLEGPIAPGEIVSVFGEGFVPGETQLVFDRVPARLLFESPAQINAQAPGDITAASSIEVQAVVRGIAAGIANVVAAPAAPGIFTLSAGRGQAAAVNEDGALNSAANPAARGSVVSLFATGEGAGAAPVSLAVGDYSAEILYAGPAPGFPGLMQVNARVPGGYAPAGSLPVVLKVGAASSQPGVTIAVR